ncbi:uncharacterized protein Z520_03257 [Fonsecaea multimorphosa CBS 102226]|uniref:Uncharacterized protein n=1 Tax=Fonsecaea multimorphosa CBS 102226 TaxID=1442371 RepID=A0A0D2KV19_9EURO|nr:uncharacterized protein Z520_03257 [Fonsecaea multimorphosa CBS 102226]KIY00594.1 hypothetical protein Z520_03257 [Fonsecaea multimorphosa CBS 102226]OAL18986.1 hypothetical protein AYO22_10315 [Fonsecaea multimorphosa]
MSRRPASDTFTRFTSTTPHATTFTYQPASRPGGRNAPSSSSPSPSSSQPPSPQQTPEETPMERVARLRAAHEAAKTSAVSSPIDRLIASGRVIADRAHRLTAYGLILFSGLAVCVTAYGTISLIAHSRRQKRAWVERELNRLDEARRAFLKGEANAEQLHLLEQERAGQEIEAARMKEVERKKEEGYWGKLKGFVGGQMAKGTMGEETAEEKSRREARAAWKQRGLKPGDDGWIDGEIQPVLTAVPAMEAVRVAPSGVKGVGIDSKGRPVPANKVEYITRKAEDEHTRVEKDLAARPAAVGGPLDVMASNVAGAVAGPSTEGGRSWLSWIRGSDTKS